MFAPMGYTGPTKQATLTLGAGAASAQLIASDPRGFIFLDLITVSCQGGAPAGVFRAYWTGLPFMLAELDVAKPMPPIPFGGMFLSLLFQASPTPLWVASTAGAPALVVTALYH